MVDIIQTMNSPRGRTFRIVLGAEMIAIGLYFDSILGWSVALAGFVPMVSTFFGHCA
jgi:Protein of unknown function (DUF2892)